MRILDERFVAHVRKTPSASTCIPAPPRNTALTSSSFTRWPPGANSPYFDEAQRAALALAEARTRLADRPDAVPDEVWDMAAKHFDQPALVAVVLNIALINTWNRRLNVITGQVAGEWTAQYAG